MAEEEVRQREQEAEKEEMVPGGAAEPWQQVEDSGTCQEATRRR